jgi:putative ABC transport system permease protein
MKLGDLFGMALFNLWRRKLRTFLTTLAVIIGAALVSIIISLGDGLQTFIERQFGAIFPDNAITAYSGADLFAFQSSVAQEITSEKQALFRAFTAEDYTQVAQIPGVERIDFGMNLITTSVRPEGSQKKYTVQAYATTDYEARLRTLMAGSFYAQDARGVCIVSYDYVQAFGWTDAAEAIGKNVVLTVGKRNIYNFVTREYTLTIVGVSEKSTSMAEILIPSQEAVEMGRFSYDDQALFSPEKPGYSLQLKIADGADIEFIADTIRAMGFQALTAGEVLARLNTVFSVVRIALSVFGGIALVVAAIGIINTLMMAIHERTREIGVMKAMGATSGAIRALFTLEGGLLGLAGGVLGTAVAIGLGTLLNFIGSRTFLSNFPGFELSVFSPMLILGVIALTTTVSLLAGLYPANRAAGLNAVDSLRYE